MKLSENIIDNKIIYMDYAATSPMKREVLKAMEPFWGEKFGNPSSIHSVGRQAKSAMDEARNTIANILNSNEQEVFFTSGGTESDNLAILGIAKISKHKGHFITTQIEHQAVLKTFQNLEKEGFEVTYLPVDKNGLISPEEVAKAILPETILVSVIYVSNEIGTLQPIKEIGKLIKKINEKSMKKIYFHTDAVQAPEYFSVNVLKQYVDLMSLSAHKFGGPKGVGVLYIKKDVPILPVIFGGEQELAMRPGTENVAGIIGMAKALEMVSNERCMGSDKVVLELRNYFEKRIMEEITETLILAKEVVRSPGISAVVFGQIDPVALVMNLDLMGICVSSGAACSSGSVGISHVIESLKLNKPYHLGAIRFCFNKLLTKEHIDNVVAAIGDIVYRLRTQKY